MTFRFIALPVASSNFGRYRLVGRAKANERTDYPRQIIISMATQMHWVPVVTVSRNAFGVLVADNYQIRVES